jgi:hypothetical protein
VQREDTIFLPHLEWTTLSIQGWNRFFWVFSGVRISGWDECLLLRRFGQLQHDEGVDGNWGRRRQY